MQHIHITDPTNCHIVNVDGGLSQLPEGAASRLCAQCDRPTWRLTPICMHCGYDRWARLRLAAGATAGATALALVIFHQLT